MAILNNYRNNNHRIYKVKLGTMAVAPQATQFLTSLEPFLNQHFLNPGALVFLGVLIPLIIIYLIRPRPHRKKVPALLFFLKETARIEHRSFFRRLFRDPLILLQILIIILICAALARPFVNVAEEVLTERVFVLIDASASSQVEFGGISRFEQSITLAKERLAKKNTVIVFGVIPEVLGTDLTKEQATNILNGLTPFDTPTSLFDAIIFTRNFVKPRDRVIVYSDFIESHSTKNYITAKNIVESEGAKVEFVDVSLGEKGAARSKNIGIIDLDIKEDKTTFIVQNFNDDAEKVRIDVPGASLTENLVTIKPNNKEVFAIDTPPGTTEVKIVPQEGHDDFTLDNSAWIVFPKKEQIGVAIVSNKPNKYLQTALSVLDGVSVLIDTPPKIQHLNQLVIVTDNIESSMILPGTMRDIQRRVNDGATLIVHAQPALFALDFGNILPVALKKGKGFVTNVSSEVQIVQASPITTDVIFGRVDAYYDVEAANDAIVLAQSRDGTPLIALRPVGNGLVVYYGLMPEHSSFHVDIYYPVFWKRILDLASRREDLADINRNTGDIINFQSLKKIQTPSKNLRDTSVVLSEKGAYRVSEAGSDKPSREIAANLLSERESDINGEIIDAKKGIISEAAQGIEKIPLDLSDHFALGILFLLFLELLWIKLRGDL
ncbi:VWA domain-containing protein [Candidatus Woesearchaeota archaeon]|nr:VWA domain-containing protein [Candidatus Woesearchaeota archaeon]